MVGRVVVPITRPRRPALALVAALAIALAAGIGVAAPADGATRSVRVDDNVFSPRSATIRRGTLVRFRWVGRRPHNVTGPGFASRTQTDGSYSRRFNSRRSYRLVCTLHSGMEMRVRVR